MKNSFPATAGRDKGFVFCSVSEDHKGCLSSLRRTLRRVSSASHQRGYRYKPESYQWDGFKCMTVSSLRFPVLFSLYQHCKELCESSVFQLQLHFGYNYISATAEAGIHMTLSILFHLEVYQHHCLCVLISYLPYLSISPKSHLCSGFFCITHSCVYLLLNYLSVLSRRNMRLRACLLSLLPSSELVSLNWFYCLEEKKVLSEHESSDLFLGINCTLDATCRID